MAAFPELVMLAISLGALNSWKDFSPIDVPEGIKSETAAQKSKSLYDLLEHFPTDKDVECPESDSKFRYPGECSRYITCRNFQAHIRSCPPGMSFDHNFQHCRLAFEVDCDDDSPAAFTCGQNEVYTPCGTRCERTCEDVHRRIDCKYECVEGCKCRMGYVRDQNERCIKPETCNNANSIWNFFKDD